MKNQPSRLSYPRFAMATALALVKWMHRQPRPGHGRRRRRRQQRTFDQAGGTTGAAGSTASAGSTGAGGQQRVQPGSRAQRGAAGALHVPTQPLDVLDRVRRELHVPLGLRRAHVDVYDRRNGCRTRHHRLREGNAAAAGHLSQRGLPTRLLERGSPRPARRRTSYVAEGYPYAFDGGSLDTTPTPLTANLSQLWAGWCGLQTPASDGSGSCLPDWARDVQRHGQHLRPTNPQTKKVVAVDCGKLSYASGAWSLLLHGGRVRPHGRTATCRFRRLPDSGDTASGSVDMPFFGTTNVHFVKN